MLLYNYIVISLGKYATISVPADVKKLLEKAKGKDEWGSFLLRLYAEVKRLKSKKAFEELASILTDEDLKAILRSSKEFRERFAFR
jgi:predicted CopG family antitoxin